MHQFPERVTLKHSSELIKEVLPSPDIIMNSWIFKHISNVLLFIIVLPSFGQ